MKVIVYIKDNEVFTAGIAKEIENLNPADIAKTTVPEECDYKIIDRSELPIDKLAQSCLNYDLTVNIDKAKEIKKNMLRIDREPLFVKLDDEKRDADTLLSIDGDNSGIIAWAEKRKVLQDITKLVDPCKTIEEIKAIAV